LPGASSSTRAHTTHRSADGRMGSVHGVSRAPQRGRPHRGRAALRLLTEQRYRWRLERRRRRRCDSRHAEMDQSIPPALVIEAIQTGFDPCIIRQICKKN